MRESIRTSARNTRLFGRYSEQKDVRLVPGPLPAPIGGGRSTTDTYHQAVLDVTHVFSPDLDRQRAVRLQPRARGAVRAFQGLQFRGPRDFRRT